MRSLLSIRPQRWVMLFSGFLLWGIGLALFVRANLGLGPWDAFHQGLGFQLGITIGTASIIASVLVLLLWIPLKQRPGIGTVFNALCIGPFIDLSLSLLPQEIESLWLRGAMMLVGMVQSYRERSKGGHRMNAGALFSNARSRSQISGS